MLSVEPLKLASGRSLQLAAGEAVPSSSVIVRNGAGQRLTKAFLEGQKQQLSVLQRLWRLTEASGELLNSAGLRHETVPGLLSRGIRSVVSAATKPGLKLCPLTCLHCSLVRACKSQSCICGPMPLVYMAGSCVDRYGRSQRC